MRAAGSHAQLTASAMPTMPDCTSEPETAVCAISVPCVETLKTGDVSVSTSVLRRSKRACDSMKRR